MGMHRLISLQPTLWSLLLWKRRRLIEDYTFSYTETVEFKWIVHVVHSILLNQVLSNLASEASPTLGCSIEISRAIQKIRMPKIHGQSTRSHVHACP